MFNVEIRTERTVFNTVQLTEDEALSVTLSYLRRRFLGSNCWVALKPYEPDKGVPYLTTEYKYHTWSTEYTRPATDTEIWADATIRRIEEETKK